MMPAKRKSAKSAQLFSFFFMSILILLLSACSSPTASPPPSAPTIPPETATLPPSTPTVAQQPTQDAQKNGCPTGTADATLFTNVQDNYCLLIPNGFSTSQPTEGLFIISGPALDESMESLRAMLTISRIGSSGGRTLSDISQETWSGAREAYNQNTITLGGETAVLAEGLLIGEAEWKIKEVLVIHEGMAYKLTFTPVDESANFAKALPDIQILWDTVMASFVFMPLEGQAPEQDYQSLEVSDCQALSSTLSNFLGVSIEITNAAFEDYVNNLSGTGCQLAFIGGTSQFASLEVIDSAMRSGLETNGWVEDALFTGGGGGMIGSAFRKNNKLCLYLAREADAGGNKKQFSISLNCATATSSAAQAFTQAKAITPGYGLVSGKICYPSEGNPAMMVYFLDTLTMKGTALPIAQNQALFQIELPPNSYIAYAWLPDKSASGLYSKAVLCGLDASCSDHNPMPFPVWDGKSTEGIDICDWNHGIDLPDPSGS